MRKNQRRKYARIPFEKERISKVKKIYGVRFKLGFSNARGKKSRIGGRLSFLLSDFKNRTAEENTRSCVNFYQLKKLPHPIHQDLNEEPLLENYSFLIITDPHIKSTNHRNLEKLPNACLDSDAFVVFTGDATTKGTEEQLAIFNLYIQKMPIPVYPVIGNHDIYHNNWKTWFKYMGQSVYRIDSGSTTLLMLDSANGILGSHQLEWLEQQLETPNKHVFVFSHCNFFIPRETIAQQFSNLTERSKFINICANKVQAVFTGHSHRLYSHVAKNVPYINLDDFRDTGTFCRVNVTPKGFQCTYGSVADIR
ncbi:MAG: hypothetical protein BKP49_05915 [Treponema sp. CETP13]|nr:MAG: hypothetical protein BKP49_05915 [Treponema sp. CETP13]